MFIPFTPFPLKSNFIFIKMITPFTDRRNKRWYSELFLNFFWIGGFYLNRDEDFELENGAVTEKLARSYERERQLLLKLEFE